MMDISQVTQVFNGGLPEPTRVTVPTREDEGLLLRSEYLQAMNNNLQSIRVDIVYFPETGEFLTFASDKVTKLQS